MEKYLACKRCYSLLSKDTSLTAEFYEKQYYQIEPQSSHFMLVIDDEIHLDPLNCSVYRKVYCAYCWDQKSEALPSIIGKHLVSTCLDYKDLRGSILIFQKKVLLFNNKKTAAKQKQRETEHAKAFSKKLADLTRDYSTLVMVVKTIINQMKRIESSMEKLFVVSKLIFRKLSIKNPGISVI